MDNDNYFSIVYKMLKLLDTKMKSIEFDNNRLSCEKIGINEQYYSNVLETMFDDGLVKGLIINHYTDGSVDVDIEDLRITSKGQDYLKNNSNMVKMAKIAKNILDIVK